MSIRTDEIQEIARLKDSLSPRIAVQSAMKKALGTLERALRAKNFIDVVKASLNVSEKLEYASGHSDDSYINGLFEADWRKTRSGKLANSSKLKEMSSKDIRGLRELEAEWVDYQTEKELLLD